MPWGDEEMRSWQVPNGTDQLASQQRIRDALAARGMQWLLDDDHDQAEESVETSDPKTGSSASDTSFMFKLFSDRDAQDVSLAPEIDAVVIKQRKIEFDSDEEGKFEAKFKTIALSAESVMESSRIAYDSIWLKRVIHVNSSGDIIEPVLAPLAQSNITNRAVLKAKRALTPQLDATTHNNVGATKPNPTSHRRVRPCPRKRRQIRLKKIRQTSGSSSTHPVQPSEPKPVILPNQVASNTESLAVRMKREYSWKLGRRRVIRGRMFDPETDGNPRYPKVQQPSRFRHHNRQNTSFGASRGGFSGSRGGFAGSARGANQLRGSGFRGRGGPSCGTPGRGGWQGRDQTSTGSRPSFTNNHSTNTYSTTARNVQRQTLRK